MAEAARYIGNLRVLEGDIYLESGKRVYPDRPRSELAQETAVYDLPIENWRVTGTGALLGTAAGTPSGAFGMTFGTHGTAAPMLVGEAASNNSKTNSARMTIVIPPEYEAAETFQFRARVKESVGAATVSTTIDCEAHLADGDGAVGSDICATAAIDVTTTAAWATFTITATTLEPGGKLDIEITGVTNDTGGAIGTILQIYETQLLIDIRG